MALCALSPFQIGSNWNEVSFFLGNALLTKYLVSCRCQPDRVPVGVAGRAVGGAVVGAGREPRPHPRRVGGAPAETARRGSQAAAGGARRRRRRRPAPAGGAALLARAAAPSGHARLPPAAHRQRPRFDFVHFFSSSLIQEKVSALRNRC